MTRNPQITLMYHESSLRHSPGPGHSESPKRASEILNWAEMNHLTVETARAASKEEILSVHDEELYRLVEMTQKEPIAFTGDTLSNEHTFKAAIHSAGAAIESIARSTVNCHFFSFARPPGHHATRERAQGFCYFNSIAIGVDQLLKRDSSVNRAVIIDHDNHFGNGTYEIFEESSDVLYISLHADPRWCYPGWGSIADIGQGDGEGYNICITMPLRASDLDYKLAFEQTVIPIIRQFEPDRVVCSVGFDAYRKDPLGVLGLSEDGYRLLGTKIVKDIGDYNSIPVTHILEGGYNIRALSGLMGAYLSPYLDHEGEIPKLKDSPTKTQTQNVLNQLQDILSPFWTFS
ncbi:MAG: histone deacetylase family protein [Candidatus Heimdallarchaeota archaeon]